jgi:hypothetical protein
VFALIELGIFETPVAGVRLVNPSILAQTTLIERGVIHIDDSGATGSRILVRPPDAPLPSTGRGRRLSIGEDEFYELLDEHEPGIAANLKNFLAHAESHGIYPEFLGGLNLKHASPSDRPFNLGTITKGGLLDTGPATWFGRTDVGRVYNGTLARLIGGHVGQYNNGRESGVRTASGKLPRLSDYLPRHADAWLAAIDEYTASFASDDQN